MIEKSEERLFHCLYLLSSQGGTHAITQIHRLKAKTIMRLADQLSFSCLLIGTTMLPAGATSDGATVWTKASEIMQDVYSQIVSISTITAIVCASVALLLMNFSKNGRTVDDSRAWLKRIVITWAILNGLGFIMAYITPFFAGGTWTPGANS